MYSDIPMFSAAVLSACCISISVPGTGASWMQAAGTMAPCNNLELLLLYVAIGDAVSPGLQTFWGLSSSSGHGE